MRGTAPTNALSVSFFMDANSWSSELDGRWYSPQATYFRVRADDGNYYVLRHDEAQDFWTLDGFRAARGEPMNSAPIDATTKPGLRQHQRVRVPAGLEIQVAGIGNGLLVDRSCNSHRSGRDVRAFKKTATAGEWIEI